MKAFLFDFVNKLQRTSDALDAKTILCNKTWRVFSDSGDKEVYIFMEDGKLVISMNGIVDIGTWMYIPANQSLVITGKQNYLVHPVICNDILALVVDGTNQCAFLLDDTKRELEAVKSLKSISSYISSNINKVPKVIETLNNNKDTFIYKPTDIANNEPKYVFGATGKLDGEVSCLLELRQLKRSGYPFVRGKYSCKFEIPKKITMLYAYSSDYNSIYDYSFEVMIMYGNLMHLQYKIKNAPYSACVWADDEKNFWGSVKRWTKKVDFYQDNKIISEKTWFSLYEDNLRKDIRKFEKELIPVLGIDCIINLFRSEVDKYWYP